MTILSLGMIVFCFLLIWLSSGVVVSSVGHLAHRLKLSQFMISFFLLGFVTSLPELSVVINSLVLGTASISLGNLIGGQVLLLFFIIPIITILGGGMRFTFQMQDRLLLLTIFVISLPSLVVIDQQVSLSEALALGIAYVLFMAASYKKAGILERLQAKFQQRKKREAFLDVLKAIGAVTVLMVASNFLIKEVKEIALFFGLHPFVLSAILTAAGTNIPELSIAVRSILLGHKDLALGEYMGSAAVNTILVVILVLGNTTTVVTDSNTLAMSAVMAIGFLTFALFARSKKSLSVSEGAILIFFYLAFVGVSVLSEVGS